jgi:hypothetical protein
MCTGGVSIRENLHGTLLCDIPPRAIQSVVVVSEKLIRFLTSAGNVKLAVNFEHHNSLAKLLELYDANSIQYTMMQSSGASARYGIFPDCNDPRVQEFMLRLLFSSGMENFVSDIEEWLRKLETTTHQIQSSDTLGSQQNSETESTWQQE